jgi:hypothetical protein
MSTVTQSKVDAASVPTPEAGKVKRFVDDADGVTKEKDELDQVRPSSLGAATSLSLAAAEQMPLDQDPVGQAGDVLTQTVDAPMQEAAFKNPRTQLVSHMVWQKRAPVVAGPVVNDLTLDELLLIDLEDAGGAGEDVEVLLPPADTLNAHRAVAVKIYGNVDLHKVTLTPDGGDVIDKALTTREMTFDRESIMLRVRVGGGGWIEYEG